MRIIDEVFVQCHTLIHKLACDEISANLMGMAPVFSLLEIRSEYLQAKQVPHAFN